MWSRVILTTHLASRHISYVITRKDEQVLSDTALKPIQLQQDVSTKPFTERADLSNPAKFSAIGGVLCFHCVFDGFSHLRFWAMSICEMSVLFYGLAYEHFESSYCVGSGLSGLF